MCRTVKTGLIPRRTYFRILMVVDFLHFFTFYFFFVTFPVSLDPCVRFIWLLINIRYHVYPAHRIVWLLNSAAYSAAFSSMELPTTMTL